jgi:hypothetical protein
VGATQFQPARTIQHRIGNRSGGAALSSTAPRAEIDGDVERRALGLSFGQRIPGLIVNGKELRAPVFNENEVRAAAGITMVVGAVAFSFAYFRHQYIPLQAVSSFFLLEFLIRVTLGVRYSPVGQVARVLMRNQPPQWVSAKPKRFAWTIGLGIAFAMTIITNSGIRGWTPRSMCLVCLTMMWLESALGLCLGCQLYGWLARRGWIAKDDAVEICADGSCEVPWQKAAQ